MRNAQKRPHCLHWAFWPLSAAAAIDIKCRMQPALSASSPPALVLRVHFPSTDAILGCIWWILCTIHYASSSSSSSAIDQCCSIHWLAVIVIDPGASLPPASALLLNFHFCLVLFLCLLLFHWHLPHFGAIFHHSIPQCDQQSLNVQHAPLRLICCISPDAQIQSSHTIRFQFNNLCSLSLSCTGVSIRIALYAKTI